VDDDEQHQRSNERAPKATQLGELVECHTVEPGHQMRRKFIETGRQGTDRSGDHHECDAPQDRQSQPDLLDGRQLAQRGLAPRRLDRPLRGRKEREQDRDVHDDQRWERYCTAAPRDHPHRGRQDQPRQRMQQSEWTERGLGTGGLERELFAEGDCHRIVVTEEFKPVVAWIIKIDAKAGADAFRALSAGRCRRRVRRGQ
jgi:hypothetical protein